MTFARELLLSGMILSFFLFVMVRVLSVVNLTSSFRFLFLKIGLIFIVLDPIGATLFPTISSTKVVSFAARQMAYSFSSSSSSSVSSIGNSIHLSQCATIAYFCVLFCLALRLIVQILRMRSFLKACRPFSLPDIKVPLLLSSNINAPFSVNIPRLAIVLPEGMIHDLDRQRIELAIQHELIHIQRKDHIFKIFALFLKIVWFFWPPIYWINRELEAAMEISCDAELLATSKVSIRTYGELLIYFATKGSQVEGFGLGVSNSFLNRRIMFMKTQQIGPRKYVQAFCLIALIAANALISAYTIQSMATPLSQLDYSGKQLKCKCEDKSTSTHHELYFRFLSEREAKVTLTVTKDSVDRAVCHQSNRDFTVAKSGTDALKMNGFLNCGNQKPQAAEINFDGASMTLPRDICHKDTIFYCKWST